MNFKLNLYEDGKEGLEGNSKIGNKLAEMSKS